MTASGGVTFVVRDRGSWLLAPVPVAEPEPISGDDLVALLHGAPDDGGLQGLSPASDTSRPGPLAPGALVAPVWTWVGVVTSRGIALEGNDGEVVVLDADDLRLLDALDGPATVAAMAQASGVADAPARLGRLVAAGRLKLLDPGPPTGTPDG